MGGVGAILSYIQNEISVKQSSKFSKKQACCCLGSKLNYFLSALCPELICFYCSCCTNSVWKVTVCLKADIILKSTDN